MADEMRCPYCGSDLVSCIENTSKHVHICHGCGARDVYRGRDDFDGTVQR